MEVEHSARGIKLKVRELLIVNCKVQVHDRCWENSDVGDPFFMLQIFENIEKQNILVLVEKALANCCNDSSHVSWGLLILLGLRQPYSYGCQRCCQKYALFHFCYFLF